MKTKCIAMILAGGKGTRLKQLTSHIPKPAVPFGGRYRIIDFVLSNCRNSSIKNIGVLTQYARNPLHEYLGNGKKWGLNGGLTLLPPYQYGLQKQWYDGTANAVFQNLDFIEEHNPEHVLILAADHIYKMDYNEMLYDHMNADADITIAVQKVPLMVASRFGIMITNAEGRIIKFEEKPIYPLSDLASMGIYLFKWRPFKEWIESGINKYENSDFGHDVIPTMLMDGYHLHAHHFNTYWRDVGTIESYWEANMDLLKEEKNVFFEKKNWDIYTDCSPQAPRYISPTAVIRNSIINEGCKIYGEVINSVIFFGVSIGHGSIIKDSIVLPFSTIGKNVIIEKSVVNSNTSILDNSWIHSNTITFVRNDEPPQTKRIITNVF